MAKPKKSKQEQGLEAEDRACAFLERNGLTIVERNYRWKHGEIDIIAKDGDCHVFVEVRYRDNPERGSSIESVTPQKLHHVVQSVKHYLLSEDLYDKIMTRIDIIGFEHDLGDPIWLKNVTM